jgi:very-short-patch-repair endonuclease
MSPTPEAISLRTALEKLGLVIESERFDGYKHVDLSIKSVKIDIEIDGRQHLLDGYQLLADLRRSHFSHKNGYSTIHIHNSEIHENLEQIAVSIAEAVKIIENKFKGKEGWVELV